VFSLEACRDAKEGMNETLLPDHIALRQPPDLPLLDQSSRCLSSRNTIGLLSQNSRFICVVSGVFLGITRALPSHLFQ
jgi:hypothetical protein